MVSDFAEKLFNASYIAEKLFNASYIVRPEILKLLNENIDKKAIYIDIFFKNLKNSIEFLNSKY